MARITKKMLAEQEAKEKQFQKNTNTCIALVTQKLNIIIGAEGYMYLQNCDTDFEDLSFTIPLTLDGRRVKSTMVGVEIDSTTEVAFDPYNNLKLVMGLINIYLDTYYPGVEIITMSLATKHINQLGNAVLKLSTGEEFKSDMYVKDTLKYLDILYQLDSSSPPEFRVLKEIDLDERTR